MKNNVKYPNGEKDHIGKALSKTPSRNNYKGSQKLQLGREKFQRHKLKTTLSSAFNTDANAPTIRKMDGPLEKKLGGK